MARVARITGTHCTVERHNGEFCDAPSAEGMPFPICARHAIKLYNWMRDVVDSTEPMMRAWQVIRQQQSELARAEERAKHVKHTVYYVKVGELIKIGYTSRLRQRMNAYPPTSWLMATEPGNGSVERQRHNQFADLRTHGQEWYRPGPKLITHINALRRASGAPPVNLGAAS